MGSTKKDIEAARLRQRPEIGRLRARGGLTREVLVDARSIAEWCSTIGLAFAAVVAEICAAADEGRGSVGGESSATSPTDDFNHGGQRNIAGTADLIYMVGSAGLEPATSCL